MSLDCSLDLKGKTAGEMCDELSKGAYEGFGISGWHIGTMVRVG